MGAESDPTTLLASVAGVASSYNPDEVVIDVEGGDVTDHDLRARPLQISQNVKEEPVSEAIPPGRVGCKVRPSKSAVESRPLY